MIQDCITFFQSGGIFMYPLLVCSILVVSVIIYRMLNMRRSCVMPEKLINSVYRTLSGTQSVDELKSELERENSSFARLVKIVLTDETGDTELLKERVQARAKKEFHVLQSGLSVLDMVATIAPMFGILGTASGLVVIFGVFGQGSADEYNMITQGISQALNTTIVGLAIATPAVIASVYYSRKLERQSSQMESLLIELISHRYQNH